MGCLNKSTQGDAGFFPFTYYSQFYDKPNLGKATLTPDNFVFYEKSVECVFAIYFWATVEYYHFSSNNNTMNHVNKPKLKSLNDVITLA